MNKKQSWVELLIQNNLPLSWWTNRLAILFIIVFYIISCIVVFRYEEHRVIIISLLIALSGAIGLLIVTIASPNHQIEWINKFLDRKDK